MAPSFHLPETVNSDQRIGKAPGEFRESVEPDGGPEIDASHGLIPCPANCSVENSIEIKLDTEDSQAPTQVAPEGEI